MHGTFYAYLIDLTKTKSGGWRTLTCTWLDAIVTQLAPNKYRTFGINALNPHAITLEIAPPPAGQPTRTTSGFGPARFPTNDVFDGWTLVDTDTADKWSEINYQDPCDALADNPVPPELRAKDYVHTDYPDPLPTLPPQPGWPAES